MQFEKTTITVQCKENETLQVEATQGVGTGLAYHQALYTPDSLDADETRYSITHIASGYTLCALTVATEEEAQGWLERVAPLDRDHWNIDLKTLKQRHFRNRAKMLAEFEEAHANSIIQFFMYAENAEGEPLLPSTDASLDDAKNQKTANELLAYYPEAVRVRLIKMPQQTWQHELLRVYERETVNA